MKGGEITIIDEAAEIDPESLRRDVFVYYREILICKSKTWESVFEVRKRVAGILGHWTFKMYYITREITGEGTVSAWYDNIYIKLHPEIEKLADKVKQSDHKMLLLLAKWDPNPQSDKTIQEQFFKISDKDPDPPGGYYDDLIAMMKNGNS